MKHLPPMLVGLVAVHQLLHPRLQPHLPPSLRPPQP